MNTRVICQIDSDTNRKNINNSRRNDHKKCRHRSVRFANNQNNEKWIIENGVQWTMCAMRWKWYIDILLPNCWTFVNKRMNKIDRSLVSFMKWLMVVSFQPIIVKNRVFVLKLNEKKSKITIKILKTHSSKIVKQKEEINVYVDRSERQLWNKVTLLLWKQSTKLMYRFQT